MVRSTTTIYLLLIIQGFSQAQDSTRVPDKWSLQQCIEYAKKFNIQVNSLRLTEQTAEQEVLLARAQKLPGVTGTASASLTNSKNANPVVGGFQTQASFANNYLVNSSWVIYNGGYL